ncbi:MAG: hypothetical protein ACREQQ_02275 [Candidatus Binatia bacterium]
MATLWVVYREGLRLLGAPIATVPLEPAATRLDVAPWRFFTATAPEQIPADELERTAARKRALLEVGDEDRYELCGLGPGFYESPYSPEECRRRLNL